MAKAKAVYPSKYLKADDLKNKPRTLTIKRAPVEDSFGEQKVVLYFEETEKAFTLNSGNARILIQLLEDDETDNWAGVKVTLTPTMRPIAGELKKLIDVTGAERPMQAKAAGAGVEEDDDIPF